VSEVQTMKKLTSKKLLKSTLKKRCKLMKKIIKGKLEYVG
jgi:hypothetical protein